MNESVKTEFAVCTDERVKGTEFYGKEVQVFTYAKEEKETNCVYLYLEGYWMVETSVPTHITKILKLNNVKVKEVCVTTTGTITSIKAELNAKQISFRNLSELSEEQKQKRSETMKQTRERV